MINKENEKIFINSSINNKDFNILLKGVYFLYDVLKVQNNKYNDLDLVTLSKNNI